MNEFNIDDLKKLYVPAPDSHKGENGKLLDYWRFGVVSCRFVMGFASGLKNCRYGFLFIGAGE